MLSSLCIVYDLHNIESAGTDCKNKRKRAANAMNIDFGDTPRLSIVYLSFASEEIADFRKIGLQSCIKI